VTLSPGYNLTHDKCKRNNGFSDDVYCGVDWHQCSYDEEVMSEKLLLASIFIDKTQVFEMQGSSLVGQKL